MAAFQFFQLPPELQDEIIKKFDALELCRLKRCNKHLGHLLTTPEFVARHNNTSQDNSGESYSLMQIEPVNGVGVISGFRFDLDEVKTYIRINLADVFAGPGDILTLIYCCRSHLLFSMLTDRRGMHLVVFNFTNRSLMHIQCPPEFVDVQNIKMTVFALGGELHFRIIHVFMDKTMPFPVPRVSVFDSRLDGWSTCLQVAHYTPHQNVHLDLYNENLMIIPHGDEWVLFVTMQDEVPLFGALHVDRLFSEELELSMSVLNLRTGWNIRPVKHYAPGDQGWVANIITHVHDRTGATVIKDVSLFWFNPESKSYEHKSTIERRAHQRNQNLDIRGVLCEANDEIVQVRLVLNHGVNSWSYKMFVYWIDAREWSVNHVPQMDDKVRVGLPRLTSRLTV